jgi:ATP/ADP translocase
VIDIKKLVRAIRKETFLELALFVGFFLIFTLIVFEFNDKAIIREELSSNLAAGINNCRIDKEAIFYAIKQRIAIDAWDQEQFSGNRLLM